MARCRESEAHGLGQECSWGHREWHQRAAGRQKGAWRQGHHWVLGEQPRGRRGRGGQRGRGPWCSFFPFSSGQAWVGWRGRFGCWMRGGEEQENVDGRSEPSLLYGELAEGFPETRASFPKSVRSHKLFSQSPAATLEGSAPHPHCSREPCIVSRIPKTMQALTTFSSSRRFQLSVSRSSWEHPECCSFGCWRR